MRKQLTLLAVFVCFGFVTHAVNWKYSFETAQKEALAMDKLMIVDFWASWCGPCKLMDTESWDKDEVSALMSNYVAVKIDIDKEKDLARKYGVNSIPFIFLMDGNGKIIKMHRGYQTKSQVMNFLKTYAFNTTYIKNDLINYYKQENFLTSYRLASKIQKYALHLPMKVRSDFLKLSNQYFSEAKRFLEKSEGKHYEVMTQKIDLHEIQELLVIKKSKKAQKKLEKIESSDIFDENKSFYALLNFISDKQLAENQPSEWEAHLSENDIKWANLFLKTD